ncbi:MAG: GNAT family N-acetyltransferase [Firmicutes bacterium]|nr:GNAT family N-acetyltransferase [Bacillota bacterium]
MIKEYNDIEYLNKLSSYNITINPFNKILVYMDGNTILGFIDYSKMYENMEINYIFVIEQYRNKGIASKLLEYVINNNDFSNITLEVNINNINAIKLYEKYNFKTISIRKGYYNGIDAYLMERRNL